jgi:diacylglycerol kinase family enzyme
LDVSVVHRPELLQLIKGLWLLVNGRLLNLKVVKPYRTHKVKILRVQNAAISLDGRQLYYDESSLDVRILPEALTLIIPK